MILREKGSPILEAGWDVVNGLIWNLAEDS